MARYPVDSSHQEMNTQFSVYFSVFVVMSCYLTDCLRQSGHPPLTSVIKKGSETSSALDIFSLVV